MSQLKVFFSSKPKQIAQAIVKISHQIFGKTSDVEIAIIGDEEMVEDISAVSYTHLTLPTILRV